VHTDGQAEEKRIEMWLFTPEGFFSVVLAEEFGHEREDRARDAADLDRLRDTRCPGLGDPVRLPGRNYPARAFVTCDDLVDFMGRLARGVDCGNFTSAVAARNGVDRVHVYGDVWRDRLQIEGSAEAG
jgi:hypothetical protein